MSTTDAGRGLRRRLAAALAWMAVLAVAGLLVWGLGLAIRGAWARFIPRAATPRLAEHAVIIREEGSGRYLVYTEIQVRPGDLLITPDGRLWRIERVGFDTAWARPVADAGEVPPAIRRAPP